MMSVFFHCAVFFSRPIIYICVVMDKDFVLLLSECVVSACMCE